MSKLLQFRCPKCCRVLFKVEEGAEELSYRDKGMRFYKGKNGKMIVECSKCLIISEVTPHGLVEFKTATQNAGVQVPVLR